MQALFEFIQKLCALVMIALLADLMMPSGTMRKYVRLACGMLVLHIMVSQVFAFFGRSMPDVTAQQWNQLVGEMRTLSDDTGMEEALSAYRRQAEQLILEKARAMGMSEPIVSIAWDAANRVAALIMRDQGLTVPAGARMSEAAVPVEADYEGIRSELAEMLELPAQAIYIQKEGDGPL